MERGRTQREEAAAKRPAPRRPVPAQHTRRPPLHLTNLLNDLENLAALAPERVAAGDLFNAYLLAAGMEQVTADHLERDRLRLRRAADRLRQRHAALPARLAAGLLRGTAAMLQRAAERSPSERAARIWHGEVRQLVDAIADELVAARAWEAVHPVPELLRRSRDVAAGAERLPARLRRSVLRLPTCFRNLDQTPADLERLTGRFDAGWYFRSAPAVVVGIRSSGSYLAPLHAAFLRALGWRDVRARTLRPGAPCVRALARELRDVARQNGVAIVVDDPPRTWTSIVKTTRDLGRFGFEPHSTPVMVQVLPGSEVPPQGLTGYPVISLPWREWDVRRRLRPARVGRVMRRALGSITAVRTIERPDGRRGHADAVFEVTTANGAGPTPQLVRVRGVGTGYFGEHTLAVAQRLPQWIPAVYAFEGGLVYEADGGRPLAKPIDAAGVDIIATYVADRAAALPGPAPGEPSYPGNAAGWAAERLAPLLGRASEAGRPIAAAIAARALVPVAPALVDGRTEPSAFACADGRRIKRSYDSGVFTGIDLFCFDPVFDLARAAVADPAAAAALRQRFEALTSVEVDAARWLLLQLVHVHALDGEIAAEAGIAMDRLPRAFQAYYGEVLLADTEPASAGPICAIDVDGVLEAMPLGFPASSPAAILGLRALTRHGFRPVLVTGRSAAEVEERCLAYRLAGGVAEYGAVAVGGGRAVALIDDEEAALLARLRSTLGRIRGVVIDPGHGHSVRAFRIVDGRRRGLASDEVEAALRRARARDRIRVVAGRLQTDFTPRRVSKETGLKVLQHLIDRGLPHSAIAMAIGDTEADAGMLAQAATAFAPAGSASELRRAGARFLPSRGPAAVAEAAASLLGHRPGGCPLCAGPEVADPLLLDLLAVRDHRGLARAAAMLRLAVAALRAREGTNQPVTGLTATAGSAEATPAAR